MTTCTCGEPALEGLQGHCQTCWNADLLRRYAEFKAQRPEAFRPPNKRLEWRVR